MDHRGRIPGRVIKAVDIYHFTRLVAVVVAQVCIRHDVLISFEVQHVRIETSEAFLPSRSSLKFSRRFLEEGRRPMASDYRKLRSWQFSFCNDRFYSFFLLRFSFLFLFLFLFSFLFFFFSHDYVSIPRDTLGQEMRSREVREYVTGNPYLKSLSFSM